LDKLPFPEAERGNLDYPSVKTIKFALMKGVQQILSFKDDQGEPMNENASRFLVMVPTCWMDITNAAINSSVLSGAETNDLAAQETLAWSTW
jgi:hypothetical protein